MDPRDYKYSFPAEPLARYGKGGYHPTHLGDVLKDGRYKILHKLGWGGYSTVWAARDQKAHRYVAVKINVSELGDSKNSREVKALQALADIAVRTKQPQCQYLLRMLDHFQIDGPNGTHACLVLEMTGPSVSDVLDPDFGFERLSRKLAKNIAKQALLGLEYLHQHKIGHGDLDTRNLAFTLPSSIHRLSESKFRRRMGKPRTTLITRKDGLPLEPGLPKYFVESLHYDIDIDSADHMIKIIDFGQSFLSDDIPDTLNTPLPVRAPEIIFGDALDRRVDLWSMGCMIYVLVTAMPPFPCYFGNEVIETVIELMQSIDDKFPERWQEPWHAMVSASQKESALSEAEPEDPLPKWLEKVYFGTGKPEYFSREDIFNLAKLILRLLRFEPADRAEARDILNDPWFEKM